MVKNNQTEPFEDSEKTISGYMAAQSESIQPYLQQVYTVIRKALPEAQERISWGMPTFWLKHNIIHFAAAKHHLGIYPGSEAIQVFAEKLSPYKTSKGAIQFPYSQPIPYSLIAEIAIWCQATANHH